MKTFQERFWEKVEKTDGCWNWTSAKSVDGYGKISLAGKPVYAHRVMFEFERGFITKGMCVLHKCDNPSCVNPEHLWLGTHKENMRDRDMKGRQASGERSGRCKIREIVAQTIKRAFKAGYSKRYIMKNYRFPRTIVESIIYNKAWVKVSC